MVKHEVVSQEGDYYIASILSK